MRCASVGEVESCCTGLYALRHDICRFAFDTDSLVSQSIPTMRAALFSLLLASCRGFSLQMTVTTTSTTTDTRKSRTQRIMEGMTSPTQASGSAGGKSSYDFFMQQEANWRKLRDFKESKDPMSPNMKFITDDGAQGNPAAWKLLQETEQLDYDAVICGGTLGVFFGVALLLRNPSWKLTILEAAPVLQGRDQEWNISRDELDELIALGILTREEVEAVITTEFPACRSGFKNKEVTPLKGGYFDNDVGYETTTDAVLNCGVAPKQLLEIVKERFTSLGGTVQEGTRLQGVVVSESVGVALDMGDDQLSTTGLLLDCMGNASPISRQQRYGMKPDGVCAVVGSCASGFDPETNKIGDIIYTNSELQDKGENGKLQYFWEAFPVNIGRNGQTSSDMKTTYMFTYMDADEMRPDLTTLMEDYWDLLPEYQPSISDPEKDLEVHRVLAAYFPTYRDSPLQPQFSRVLAIGDASGIQSPLSFGGFGALCRHMERLTDAIGDALEHDLLTKEDLGEINAYTPNLSAAWMFQKAMSVRLDQKGTDPKFVNRLLATNFEIMDEMGYRTIKPFLQDVIRIDGLAGSLARAFVADPTFMPQIVGHVGLPNLVDWLGHIAAMSAYTALHAGVSPVLRPFVDTMKDPRSQFRWRRRMEAWKYGSGGDYILPKE